MPLRPLILLAVLLLAGCSSPRLSEEPTVWSVTRVLLDSGASGGYEHWEPMAVTDPHDPDHLVVATTEVNPLEDTLQQGFLGAFVSHDGGQTWSRSLVPRGGPAYTTYYDPVLLVDHKTGDILLTGLGITAVEPQVPAWLRSGYDLLQWRSTDGGLTFVGPDVIWQSSGLDVMEFVTGRYVDVDFRGADKQWMAQAPDGTIALVWSLMLGNPTDEPLADRFDLVLMLSRDGGRSWEEPAVVYSGGFPGFAVPLLAEAGWFLAFYDYGPEHYVVASSADQGATWSIETFGGPVVDRPYVSIQESEGKVTVYGECMDKGRSLVCAATQGPAGWSQEPVSTPSDALTVVQTAKARDGAIGMAWFASDIPDADALLFRSSRLAEPLKLDNLGRPSWHAGHYIGLTPTRQGFMAVAPNFNGEPTLVAYLVEPVSAAP